jgi:DNA-binding MarR family transcriptional regulator
MFLDLENLVKQYRTASNAALHDLGLKSAEIVCLQTLMYYPDGLSAANLCSAADRDKAQISRTLKSLMSKGYIQENPSDVMRRRKKRWILTDAGKLLSEQMLDKNSTTLKAMEEEMTRFENPLPKC